MRRYGLTIWHRALIIFFLMASGNLQASNEKTAALNCISALSFLRDNLFDNDGNTSAYKEATQQQNSLYLQYPSGYFLSNDIARIKRDLKNKLSSLGFSEQNAKLKAMCKGVL